jgi:endoglucanase
MMLKKKKGLLRFFALLPTLLLFCVISTTPGCSSEFESGDQSDGSPDKSGRDPVTVIATAAKTTVSPFTLYRLLTDENFACFTTYKSDEIMVFQIGTYNDGDIASVRSKISDINDVSCYSVKVEEEKSKDSEVDHEKETIYGISAKKGVITANSKKIGEAGNKDIKRDSSHEWYTINLDSSVGYKDPIVLASVVTYNESDPCHLRIKSVGKTSFKIKLEEWAYEGGTHATETVNYIVLEKGTFDLGKANPESGWGYSLVTRTSDVSSTKWYPINFNGTDGVDFAAGNDDVFTLSTLQTNNDSNPVTVRCDPCITASTGTSEYLPMLLCEEEASTHNHADETVGYIGIGPKNGPKSDIVDKWGRLTVSPRTGRLLAENGDVKKLKGMSLFWINWEEGKRFANTSVVNWLVDDWKINVLRIPVGGDPYNQYGQQIVDSETGATYGWKDHADELDPIIQEVVNACIDKGIYVILDWHEHDAIQTKTYAKQFFKKYAKLYKNCKNVMFETWNEPSITKNKFKVRGPLYDDTRDDENYYDPWKVYGWNDTVKPYSEEIIDVIRGEGNNNIIICGTPSFSATPNIAINDPIDDDNVMYSMHFYAKSHQPARTGTDNFTNLDTAIYRYVPVFITEWGTTNCDGGQPNVAPLYSEYAKTGETGMEIDEESSKGWMKYCKDNYISWCNWSVTSKKEGSAILLSGSSYIGGWLSSDLSVSGTLIRSMIRSSDY